MDGIDESGAAKIPGKSRSRCAEWLMWKPVAWESIAGYIEQLDAISIGMKRGGTGGTELTLIPADG